MEISQGSVVSIDYTLKNDAGEVLDASRPDSPMDYLHGHGNIISGLENALLGKQAGDEVDVRVAPEEGYGVFNEQLKQVVPRDRFQGMEDLQVGMRFQANTNQGPVSVQIVAVDGENVTVDGNHPLAGQNLNFKVKVVAVREASADELSHGHVHGAGGCGH